MPPSDGWPWSKVVHRRQGARRCRRVRPCTSGSHLHQNYTSDRRSEGVPRQVTSRAQPATASRTTGGPGVEPAGEQEVTATRWLSTSLASSRPRTSQPSCRQTGRREPQAASPGPSRSRVACLGFYLSEPTSTPSRQVLCRSTSSSRHRPSPRCSTWFVASRSGRCDVNGSHRKTLFTTHKHTYDPATGTEGFYIPSDIPPIPLGPTVVRGVYRTAFAAFAAECFVELEDGYWVDPPT